VLYIDKIYLILYENSKPILRTSATIPPTKAESNIKPSDFNPIQTVEGNLQIEGVMKLIPQSNSLLNPYKGIIH